MKKFTYLLKSVVELVEIGRKVQMHRTSSLKKGFAFLFFLLPFLFLLASAQPQVDYTGKLKQAEGFLYEKRYSEAIGILKPLYSKYPDDLNIALLLKTAYYENKSYADVAPILKRILERNPHDWKLWAESGEVNLKLGEDEKADKDFAQALKMSPQNPEAYQRVALNYRVNGFTQKAIETYKLGNRNLGENVFSMDLVNLHQVARDYKSAVEEYFNFMGNDPRKFELVEKGVRNLIQSGEDLEAVELALNQTIEKDSTNRYAYKLYGDLSLARGELERAFEIYKVVDFLWEGQGGYILNFAEECQKKELFELSLDACEYLISHYRNPGLLPRAGLCKANSLKGLKKFEDAVKAYREIITDYKSEKEATVSYFNIGEIKLKELGQAEEALSWYKEVIRSPGSAVYYDALVRLGDCWMSMSELDSALFWFREILAIPLDKGKIEEIGFKLGEIDFYKGEFESALEKYQKLVLDFPRGFYVNNSLERIAILKENMEANPLGLLIFSQAMFEKIKGNSQKSISLLGKLADSQDPSLSDDSRLEIGRILRKEGDSKVAILNLERLIKDHPRSPFCALAQKLIGDIYYFDLNDLAQAEEAYLLLLKNFSSSLFVEEARINLKKINQQKVEG